MLALAAVGASAQTAEAGTGAQEDSYLDPLAYSRVNPAAESVPLTINYLWRTRGSEELSFYLQQYYRTVAVEGKTREQLVLLGTAFRMEDVVSQAAVVAQKEMSTETAVA